MSPVFRRGSPVAVSGDSGRVFGIAFTGDQGDDVLVYCWENSRKKRYSIE